MTASCPVGMLNLWILSNCVQIEGIEKQNGLQGVFVTIGDFSKSKGSCIGIPREQALLRKIKTLQKVAGKVDSSEPRLLQCTQFAHC